jgi:hypothetical protein
MGTRLYATTVHALDFGMKFLFAIQIWKSLIVPSRTAFSRRQFDLDVKTVAMFDGYGDRGERCNFTTNQHDNPGMLVAEQTKYREHDSEFNIHKLDIALWLLCALLLARWDHPL